MNKIDLKAICRKQKEFQLLYWNTCIIAINENGVHVRHDYMTDVAPLEQWTLNILRHDAEYPYEHNIIIDDVQFYSISEKPIVLPKENGTIIKADENSATARM